MDLKKQAHLQLLLVTVNKRTRNLALFCIDTIVGVLNLALLEYKILIFLIRELGI
jgi:hypothetical protein